MNKMLQLNNVAHQNCQLLIVQCDAGMVNFKAVYYKQGRMVLTDSTEIPRFLPFSANSACCGWLLFLVCWW